MVCLNAIKGCFAAAAYLLSL